MISTSDLIREEIDNAIDTELDTLFNIHIGIAPYCLAFYRMESKIIDQLSTRIKVPCLIEAHKRGYRRIKRA